MAGGGWSALRHAPGNGLTCNRHGRRGKASPPPGGLLTAPLIALCLLLPTRAAAATPLPPQAEDEAYEGLGEAGSSGATRVDRAIAVVGERVVTATEVDVAVALASRDKSPIAVLDRGDRRPGAWWIEQVMLRELAGDISVYQPEPGQLRERTERLVAAFDPAERAALQARLGIDRDAMSTWLYSRLVVERFVYRNVILAAESAGEDAAATRTRYEAWLGELQGSLAVRRISPVRQP